MLFLINYSAYQTYKSKQAFFGNMIVTNDSIQTVETQLDIFRPSITTYIAKSYDKRYQNLRVDIWGIIFQKIDIDMQESSQDILISGC